MLFALPLMLHIINETNILPHYLTLVIIVSSLNAVCLAATSKKVRKAVRVYFKVRLTIRPRSDSLFVRASSSLSYWSETNLFVFLVNPFAVYTRLSDNVLLLKEMHSRSRLVQREFTVKNLLIRLSWALLRIPYYVYNWVYSTNHKRIAVNYFWFVILSGVCGMILATIIRLEMAYPGIGILAGDSLQYLSVVTAHAVIMVFFMIMPLMFGAFGNFLLPTQLGVHDVAFPRLNSAAFWFLPGGLLMLAQLICLDRRYQRMNCFNIRELQTLLKNRYQADLWDDSLNTSFLSETSLSTRFKLLVSDSITQKMEIYNEYHLYTSRPRHHSTRMSETSTLNPAFNSVDSAYRWMERSVTNFLDTLVDFAIPYTCFRSLLPFSQVFVNSYHNSSVKDVINAPYVETLVHTAEQSHTGNYGISPRFDFGSFGGFIEALALSSVYNLRTSATSLLSPSYYVTFSDLFSSWSNFLLTLEVSSGATTGSQLNESYSPLEIDSGVTQTFNLTEKSESYIRSGHELVGDYRFQKAANPIFRYDFKVGNYLPDSTKTLNQHMFTTINDITGGIRKPSWFFSEEFFGRFQADASSYMAYYSTSSFVDSLRDKYSSVSAQSSSDFTKDGAYLASPVPTMGFYNLFNSFAGSTSFLSSRWLSLKSLDQKFHNMYATSSMQQRVYANWRQLKFTREAWRCKLLAARHQNTLYKRYIHEDSVVWAVERNAKDLLPGWAMITPFSARTRFTAIGKVDVGLFGVLLVLNSSIVSSANFLVTYRYLATLNNRKMRDAKSFFTECVMAASWMMIAANPMLVIGILMLLSDRHWQTSFFDYSGGGDTVLFQHMFWFFGHPEVYVIMIPAFGFNNTILSFYLRKRVSARASLLYSIYTIAFLGFFVWGHHMYMVGLAHTTRMLFSTLTVMISVPAATKLMHWCVTIVNSSITFEFPLIWQFLFVFLFVSGGVSGMCVAHTGMDVLFHDSFYVVGHFHVMLAGAAMFGSFGAFYFYFPSIFGVKFSRIFGYLHFVYYLLGQLMTIMPMIWLGYAGMPRRVLDYPASMGGWHAIASAGHLLSVAGMMAFFIMIFDSMRHGRAVVRTTFGVPRFNTRLNFYTYEAARTWFLQRKGWYNSRTQIRNELDVNEIRYSNYEVLETTLLNYVLLNEKNVRKEKN